MDIVVIQRPAYGVLWERERKEGREGEESDGRREGSIVQTLHSVNRLSQRPYLEVIYGGVIRQEGQNVFNLK